MCLFLLRVISSAVVLDSLVGDLRVQDARRGIARESRAPDGTTFCALPARRGNFSFANIAQRNKVTTHGRAVMNAILLNFPSVARLPTAVYFFSHTKSIIFPTRNYRHLYMINF